MLLFRLWSVTILRINVRVKNQTSKVYRSMYLLTANF